MADFILKTKFGNLRLKPTERDHIYVGTEDNLAYLQVNRVEYHISAHFYRWKDGKFYLGKENEYEYMRSQSLYMVRPSAEYKKSFPSASAKNKVRLELERAVEEWREHNNLAIVIAEKIYLKDAIRSRKASLKELEDAQKEIEREIDRLEKGEHLLSYCRYTLTTNRAAE